MIPRLCLLIAAAFLLAACTPSGDKPAATPPGQPMSLLERDMMAIVDDQQRLFAEGRTGTVGEDEFVRRAASIASQYDRLVAGHPDNVTLLVLYGKFLRTIGSNKDAQIMFTRANSLDGSIAVVKQQIGNYLAEQGQYAQALALYMTAIELEPETAAYHFGVGQLLYAYREAFVEDGAFTREGIDNEMLKAFAEAARLEPGNRDFRFRLGEAYYDVQAPDWQAALAIWQGMGDLDLTDTERDAVRLHTARVLIEMGRKGEAAEYLAQPVAPALEATRQKLMGERLNSKG